MSMSRFFPQIYVLRAIKFARTINLIIPKLPTAEQHRILSGEVAENEALSTRVKTKYLNGTDSELL